MLCPRCQATVEPGVAFCGNCGQPLTPVPTSAGTPAVPLPPPPSAPYPAPVPNPQLAAVPQPPGIPQPPFQPPQVTVSPQVFAPNVAGAQLQPAIQPVQPLYPGGMPAQPMPAGYMQPAVHDHSGKAIAAFVLGVLALPGCLIPIVGIILGILAIVFGTMSVRSARKVLAIIGMSLAVLAILASLFFWVRNTQEFLKARKDGTSSSSSSSGSLQSVSTPCYTTKIPADMKITQTADSCTFLGVSSDHTEQEEVKVIQVPGLTAANLPDAAKQDSANVVGSIPGGSIGKQQASTFAGSQSYEIEIKATDGSAGLISYVYDTTAQGNLVIVLHVQARASGNNYDLSSIESNWAWL